MLNKLLSFGCQNKQNNCTSPAVSNTKIEKAGGSPEGFKVPSNALDGLTEDTVVFQSKQPAGCGENCAGCASCTTAE